MARKIVRTAVRLYDREPHGFKCLASPAGAEGPLDEYERLRRLPMNGGAAEPVAAPPVESLTSGAGDDAAPKAAGTGRKGRGKGGREARVRKRSKQKRSAPAPVIETVAEAGDPEPDPEPLAWEAMLRAQLLVEAKRRGLAVTPTMSKTMLIAMLKAAER